jgi:hypothetical protein
MQLLGGLSARAQESLDVVLASRPHTVVIASAPVALLGSYLQPERAYFGRPRPERLYFLSTASSGVMVERTGEAELRVRPEQGFLYTPLEKHYRGSSAGLEAGSSIDLAAMSARVEASEPGGRPAAVRFTFREPLDGQGIVLLRWVGDHYEPLALAVGESISLPEEDIGKILVQHALGLASGAAGRVKSRQ